LDYMHNLNGSIYLLKKLLKIDADHYGLRAAVNIAIYLFLSDKISESKKYLIAASKIREKPSLEFRNRKIYWAYLLNILERHQKMSFNYSNFKKSNKLFVIGESHALSSHSLYVQCGNEELLCKSLLIQGCTQWNLGNKEKNKYKRKFEKIFQSLPESSAILLAIGEIDCRIHTGIIKYKDKFPEKDVDDLITSTIVNYLNYIDYINNGLNNKICIQGVPCPNRDPKNISEKKMTELVHVIRLFNIVLKKMSWERGFSFLDIHKMTDRGDGISNAIWHIDDIHISPEGMQMAWSEYYMPMHNNKLL